MGDMSDEEIKDGLVVFFANRLHCLKGDQASIFEDHLVAHRARLAQESHEYLCHLIALAKSPHNWTAHTAVMTLFRRGLAFSPELQAYASEHGHRCRKPGPRHDWAFDNCILSAVSWTITMRRDLSATRNPSRVMTSDPNDFEDEEAIQSASALVARALRALGAMLLDEQPPELIALFGKLTKDEINKFMLAEGTIQRRWGARPWRDIQKRGAGVTS